TLFLGYAVAGLRLKQQFEQKQIKVDADHPLFVYLPCGVGGGPGGVSFGLKLAFGEHVHCIFAEPTHSPCMLLGVYTGLHDQISVNDIGLDNITAADGLAVGRASGFVGRAMQQLIDGYYTIHDECLYELIALLNQTENIQVEPSAAAGMMGPYYVQTTPDYLALHQLSAEKLQHATHVVWATGGGMVPPDEMQKYLTHSQSN
ncbi:D-serine ammonia-lyase, partial [Acinetobacter baumannii]|nr:D-serine ammonia-lyase [Acinetobacter baumannii]